MTLKHTTKEAQIHSAAGRAVRERLRESRTDGAAAEGSTLWGTSSGRSWRPSLSRFWQSRAQGLRTHDLIIVTSNCLPTTALGRVSLSASRVAGVSSEAPIPTVSASRRPTSQRLVDVLSLLVAHPLLNGSHRFVSLTDSSVTTACRFLTRVAATEAGER